MSEKKAVSSNPASQAEMNGFAPPIPVDSRAGLPLMSSKALDDFAGIYLSQIRESEIKKAAKEGADRPATRDGREAAKNAVFPLSDVHKDAAFQRNLDITMDLNDSQVMDFPIDEEIRTAASGPDYLQKLKDKIAGFGADSTIDVQEIILTNSLLRQFALDTRQHPGLHQVSQKLDKKAKKIRERAFKWSLDGRKVGELQQLFEVTDLIKQQKQFMFVDSGVLADLFKPSLFHLFARHPMFPGDASTKEYKQVADFHNQLLSTFIKVYIQCPMSRHPHLDWTSLKSIDPFMRSEFRNRNRKFYQKHVEKAHDFSLFEYSMFLLKQFVLAEFPTYLQSFGPHAFVKIFQLVSLGFEYGLYTMGEAADIAREFAAIADIISDQQNTLKKTLSARRKSLGDPALAVGEDGLASGSASDEGARKAYLKQLGKIRLYCAKIIVQIISLNSDEEFVDKASTVATTTTQRPVSLYDKPLLLRSLSVVVFNFLVNKFSSGIPSIDFRLDDMLTTILEFFTSESTDFCIRSMSGTRAGVAEYFCSAKMVKDGDALEVNLKMKSLLRFIRRTSRAEEARNIEGLITDVCEIVEAKFRLKGTSEAREQFSIALARLNIHNQLFNLINFFTGEEKRHAGAFLTILSALSRTMSGNSAAHASFFADKNMATLKTIFQIKPVESLVVFVHTFWDDMEVFWTSAVARECLFDMLREMMGRKNAGETGEGKAREVTVALRLFCLFLRRLFRDGRRSGRWSRAMSLKYGDFLADSVLKVVLGDASFLSRLSGSNVPFESMDKPTGNLMEVEAMMTEVNGQSIEEVEMSLHFAIFKLFNEVTSTVFTDKIHSKVVQQIWMATSVSLPMDKPGVFLVKKEVLKMIRNFLVSTNNRQVSAPRTMVVNEDFIARNFFQPWIRELTETFEKEAEWLENVRKTEMMKRTHIQADVDRCLEVYTLKGLVPTLLEFVEMVRASASHMNSETELLDLSSIIGRIRTAVEVHADMFGELRLRKGSQPKRIESIAEGLDREVGGGVGGGWEDKATHRSVQNDSERSKLKMMLKKDASTTFGGNYGQFEGSLTASMAAEDQKRRKFGQLEQSVNTLHAFLAQFVMSSASDVDIRTVRVIPNGQNPKKTTTKKIADFIRKTRSQVSVLLAFESVSVRRAAVDRVNATVDQITQKKVTFFSKKEGNVVRDLFCESAKANKLNDDIAKYFVDWLFHMHADFNAMDPSDTYYLHSSHKVTLRAFVCLLEWSRKLRYAVTKHMSKSTVRPKEFDTGVESVSMAGEVLRGIFGVYLQSVNFCFFATTNDATKNAFEEDYKLMCDLLLGLCYQNPEFKAFYNNPEMGVISRLDFLAIEGKQPIFGELFFVVYILFYFNGSWKNTSSEVTQADRIYQFPLLSNLLSLCTEMITGNTRDTFGFHCQIAHDIWKGVIFREISSKETEFCDLKYRVIFFINSLLQFLDNEVIVILDEVYDSDKLFRLMLDSVAELFKTSTNWKEEKGPKQTESDPLARKKANIFAFSGRKLQGKGAIDSYRQLLSLYKSSSAFSEHVVLGFVQEIYAFLKRMASKAKFYNIFLTSRERQAKSVAEFNGFGQRPCDAKDAEDHAIVYFLMRITGSVEVIAEAAQKDGVTNRMLKREYFRLLPQTFFYTDSMDREFYAAAPMTGSNSKMEHLCNHSAVNSLELQQNQWLTSKIGQAATLLNGDFFTYYNYVLLIISFVLNVFMLIYMENKIGIEGNISYSPRGFLAVKTLAWILVSCSLVCLVFWLSFRAKLEFEMHVSRFTLSTNGSPGLTERISICFWGLFLSNFRSSSYFFHALTTLLGIYVDEVFYTLNFMMLMNVSGDIWYILHSILDQFDKILATLFLLLLVLYSYAYLILIGFADTWTEGGTDICQDFGACFLNTILLGFIPGAGISESQTFVPTPTTSAGFWKTFFLFVTFFLVVKLILINIINSIIVLTFNALRAEYCTRLYQEENVCYICSDTKWQIQKDGINFDEHTSARHSVRHYLFYQMYLRSIDFSRTTELMDFVINCCETGEYSWIPHKQHLLNHQDFRVIGVEGGTGETGVVGVTGKNGVKEVTVPEQRDDGSQDDGKGDDDHCSTYDDEAEDSDEEERDDIQY